MRPGNSVIPHYPYSHKIDVDSIRLHRDTNNFMERQRGRDAFLVETQKIIRMRRSRSSMAENSNQVALKGQLFRFTNIGRIYLHEGRIYLDVRLQLGHTAGCTRTAKLPVWRRFILEQEVSAVFFRRVVALLYSAEDQSDTMILYFLQSEYLCRDNGCEDRIVVVNPREYAWASKFNRCQ